MLQPGNVFMSCVSEVESRQAGMPPGGAMPPGPTGAMSPEQITAALRQRVQAESQAGGAAPAPALAAPEPVAAGSMLMKKDSSTKMTPCPVISS